MIGLGAIGSCIGIMGSKYLESAARQKVPDWVESAGSITRREGPLPVCC